MKMIRAYNPNGSHACISWERNNNGLYKLENVRYDSKGYYVSGATTELDNVTMEYIENEIDALKEICPRVDIF